MTTTAAFTAKDVQELRTRTGAGMMDCKKALEETKGNMEDAVEFLRKKGIAKAEKRVGRAASEGRIVHLTSPDGRHGVLVELNSETDFVSRNDAFVALAENVAQQVMRDEAIDAVVPNGHESPLLNQAWHAGGGSTVGEVVKEASGRTGENIVLRRYARFASEGAVGGYVHHNGKFAALVEIGGGNIVRGSQLSQFGMDRVSADYMGMLGTVINALALQDVLERKGIDTRVMTAIRMEELAEPYIRRRALRHFEKGRTVIFAAGTGNPYFSTDTAAVLRAIQMKADVIIKATSVDGVFSADPKKDPTATFYPTISYRDVMLEELKVMDQTAITLCKENSLPLIVLNIHQNGNVARAIRGDAVGTLVR